jgi:hypothetical protein
MNNNFSYRQAVNYTDNSYWFALLLAIVILGGLLAYRIMLILSYTGEVGGIDNNFVYDVTRSIGGLPIYTNPATPPYAITLYSPLYYNICALFGKLLKINPDEPIHVYQLCRTVSLICDIATCALLYGIMRARFRLAPELSMLAVACFASILCLLGYTFSRSDSLLLAFYAALILVLTGRSRNNKHPQLAGLGILSVCCILSKQNGIIAPVLVCTWLFIQGRKQQVVYYLIYFLGFASVLLLYEKHYHYLFLNAVVGLQNRLDLSWFYTDIFKRSMNSLWVIPLVFASVLALKYWINPDSRTDKSFAALFIIQSLFSLATSFKWGSTVGYFNESLLLSFILIAKQTAIYNSEPAESYARKTVAILLPLILLFFIHTVAEGYLFFIQRQAARKAAYEQQKEVRNYLQPRLEGHSVLNLARPNSDFFKTLFYKNITVPNMDMVDCCTLPDHTFDYSMLQLHLTDGHIGYLLTEGDASAPPEKIWDVPLNHFQKDTTINGYTIFKYRKELKVVE